MERFWSQVDKSGDCWEWLACKNAGGYGTFGLDRKSLLAHRLAYTLEVGEIPGGVILRHNCDNPGCVNPCHLSLGTRKDNADDMVKRGRSKACGGDADQWGENNPQAKLTELDIKFIRYWLSRGHSQTSVADAFGVSQSNISMINTGRRWGSL